MTITGKPTDLAIYLNTEIPPTVITTAYDIQLFLSVGGVEMAHVYSPTAGVVTISNVADLIASRLVSALTNYEVFYRLYENYHIQEGGYAWNDFQTGSYSVHRELREVNVTAEPAAYRLYFQKSIPDITIEKNEALTEVLFELKKGTETILAEKYVYDINNIIFIRNLDEVIEKYLNEDNLLLAFSYVITQGIKTHTGNFRVLKCDAEMPVDAEPWTRENFLTRSFREKRTSKARNEYLSFLHRTGFTTVSIHYTISYKSGSQILEKTGVLQEIQAPADDKVITFNASCGAVVTAAALPLATEILYYHIWLTGNTFETAVYCFYLDRQAYRYHKSFVFINCFGVLETFTATGLAVNKKTNEFGLGNIENHYRKITQDFVSEKTCNTGYLSDDEMEWLDDLIKSYSVGVYTPSDAMTEEITLVGVEKEDSEENRLQAFTFGYRAAKNNHLTFAAAILGIFDYTFNETFD